MAANHLLHLFLLIPTYSPHELHIYLTSHPLSSLPPPSTHTLTSLATIHQCTSVWLWQLPPAQSSAHHHARPGRKRCWCSEHQLQRIKDTDRTLGATVLSPWCYATLPLVRQYIFPSPSPFPTFLHSYKLLILIGLLRQVFFIHWY